MHLFWIFLFFPFYSRQFLQTHVLIHDESHSSSGSKMLLKPFDFCVLHFRKFYLVIVQTSFVKVIVSNCCRNLQPWLYPLEYSKHICFYSFWLLIQVSGLLQVCFLRVLSHDILSHISGYLCLCAGKVFKCYFRNNLMWGVMLPLS